MISVVIPTYNRANLITRSVQSVLDQTYKDIEVIVVDDCSTDNTLSKLSEIRDRRLRITSLDNNSGACVARNRGIDLAGGDFIAFNDSDDIWHQDKLVKQLALLNDLSADVAFCRFNRIDLQNGKEVIRPQQYINSGCLPYSTLIGSSIVSTQTILAKKEVFERFRFNPQMPCLQDYEWVIRAGNDYVFCLADEVLVTAYLQDDSITKSSSAIRFEGFKKIYDDYIEIWKEHPEAAADLCGSMARFASDSNRNPNPYLLLAYNHKKTIKNRLKLMLSRTNLLGLYYRWTAK